MSRPRKYTPELENIEIQLLLEGIARHYGFEFQEYATAPMRRRVWQSIRREKVRTISGLQEKLLHDYPAMERFLSAPPESALPCGPAFYVTFRKEVVPLLRTYPFVRIRHAGCRSAPELYTLAILLREEGLYEKSTIYATDVNEQTLKRVSDGIFPLATVPAYSALYEKSGGRASFTDYFSGGGGLVSTVYDYAILLQMLLNGGTYNGVRLLAHNTIRMMTTNQIGDLFVNLYGITSENKFGFNFSLITEYGSRLGPSQAGTYSWGGVFSTSYWVDPKEDMFAIIYRQMWGPHVADTDKQFKPLVYQAIND